MANNNLTNKTVEFIKKIQEQRDKLFNVSFPVFAGLGQEKREFHLKVATIAAAIGSFSFLLPSSNVLKNPSLLIIGDVLLLLVIIFSAVLFVISLKNKTDELHESYYSAFEGWGKLIELTQKLQSGEIKEKDYYNNLVKEYNSIPSYSRPTKESFTLEYIAIGTLLVALFSIALSLVLNP